jgi:hypothetical protein
MPEFFSSWLFIILMAVVLVLLCGVVLAMGIAVIVILARNSSRRDGS